MAAAPVVGPAFGPTWRYNTDMSKTYIPGDDADAIIARQVAKGNFPSAEAVVRAGVRMIEEYELISYGCG
jgi:hypothetical protein